MHADSATSIRNAGQMIRQMATGIATLPMWRVSRGVFGSKPGRFSNLCAALPSLHSAAHGLRYHHHQATGEASQ